jgi:hypothetical protein
MKNERTSARIASIAGNILSPRGVYHKNTDGVFLIGGRRAELICTFGELKALAASTLTQVSDKPKAVRKKARKAKR